MADFKTYQDAMSQVKDIYIDDSGRKVLMSDKSLLEKSGGKISEDQKKKLAEQAVKSDAKKEVTNDYIKKYNQLMGIKTEEPIKEVVLDNKSVPINEEQFMDMVVELKQSGQAKTWQQARVMVHQQINSSKQAEAPKNNILTEELKVNEFPNANYIETIVNAVNKCNKRNR